MFINIYLFWACVTSFAVVWLLAAWVAAKYFSHKGDFLLGLFITAFCVWWLMAIVDIYDTFVDYREKQLLKKADDIRKRRG